MLFEVKIDYNKLSGQLAVGEQDVMRKFSLFGMPSASMVSKILEEVVNDHARDLGDKKHNHLQYAST